MHYKITETVGDVTRKVEGTYPSDIIRIYNEIFGKYDDVEAPVKVEITGPPSAIDQQRYWK